MLEIGLFEAKNKLSSLVSAAERGEDIIITRHGHPAARLTAMRQNFSDQRVQAAMKHIKRIRQGVTLGGLHIKELIQEGRD